jgi:ABC-type oligopeptide transport system substrate-binding subunit
MIQFLKPYNPVFVVLSKGFRPLFNSCDTFWQLYWESTTSTMKKGDPDTNRSDLNKNNIIKPTLDHLSEQDRKALEAYHQEVDEIILSH